VYDVVVNTKRHVWVSHLLMSFLFAHGSRKDPISVFVTVQFCEHISSINKHHLMFICCALIHS